MLFNLNVFVFVLCVKVIKDKIFFLNIIVLKSFNKIFCLFFVNLMFYYIKLNFKIMCRLNLRYVYYLIFLKDEL